MRLAPLSLWMAAAAFAAAGLAFLAAPGLLTLVDLSPATPTASSDVRAIFGGLELGVAALLAICARRPAWYRAGLTAQALTFGGLALGRLLSLALDGLPRPVTFALWGPEIAGAALAIAALRQTEQIEPEARPDER
ncbi:DUF4345 domain-containing protein [Sorangium sp. So ce233]|uniref:DUF4345 domain-containing protein n=1 Tax=Sorangium sp. So ce233 TaxID=3133290 RepID=UPI003F63205E